MEGDQKKQKQNKIWETFAGGCRGMALSVPRGHSLPNFVFFCCFFGHLPWFFASFITFMYGFIGFFGHLPCVFANSGPNWQAGGRAAWLAGWLSVLAGWLAGCPGWLSWLGALSWLAGCPGWLRRLFMYSGEILCTEDIIYMSDMY